MAPQILKFWWISLRIMSDNGQNVNKRTQILFPNGWIIWEIRINKTHWVNEHSDFANHLPHSHDECAVGPADKASYI